MKTIYSKIYEIRENYLSLKNEEILRHQEQMKVFDESQADELREAAFTIAKFTKFPFSCNTKEGWIEVKDIHSIVEERKSKKLHVMYLVVLKELNLFGIDEKGIEVIKSESEVIELVKNHTINGFES